MNIFFRKQLPIIILCVVAIALFSLRWSNNSISIKVPIKQELAQISGAPVRLVIPNLAVDAPVEYVGLTSDGAMDTPERPADVAWYKLGPKPGETGSAVIAGHVDWKDGTPAVFANLEKLKPKDRLEIIDDQGKSHLFEVTGSRIYAADATAPEIFASAIGNHLNLITCSGVWNKAKQSYTTRLVIFTDLVE